MSEILCCEIHFGEISQLNFRRNFAVCEIPLINHSIALSETRFFILQNFLLRNFAIKISPKFRNLRNSAHACSTPLTKLDNVMLDIIGRDTVFFKGTGLQDDDPVMPTAASN